MTEQPSNADSFSQGAMATSDNQPAFRCGKGAAFFDASTTKVSGR